MDQHDTRADGHPGAGRNQLTAEQVHDVAFSKPPLGKRGYHEDEVDAFLARIEATLRDPTARGGVTPADLHNVAFSKPPIGHRGYNEDEVDAFLDLVKLELSRRLPGQGGRHDYAAPPVPVPQAPSRHEKWRVERDAIKVVDAAGVRWSVQRRWGVRYWNALEGEAYEDLGTKLFYFLINAAQLIVLWPPWFIGKCLGVRFKIVIVRNGEEVSDALVRGFSKSKRRLTEIAEMAAAGTLQQRLDARPDLAWRLELD